MMKKILVLLCAPLLILTACGTSNAFPGAQPGGDVTVTVCPTQPAAFTAPESASARQTDASGGDSKMSPAQRATQEALMEQANPSGPRPETPPADVPSGSLGPSAPTPNAANQPSGVGTAENATAPAGQTGTSSGDST